MPFGSGVLPQFGPKKWKEDDVANRCRVGEQHRQAVDADSFAGGRRHSMRERANVVDVDLLWRLVATLGHLREEATFLFRRIVEFREAVGDLHPRDVDLESLGQRRIFGLLLGQWG